ncbi:hypothetical protein N7476_004797 [Penicillium atrosanguineum]|uniref:Uncharacterized protein n=1 Tax=Penicillium atrosanguineum TaxID=1132637 RepID=A0A9W9PYP7_9EURO|nr:hypothetical protein N7476_004797 [Penicillium atrosanguineum]
MALFGMLNVGLNAVTQYQDYVAGLIPPSGRAANWLEKEAAGRAFNPTAALNSTNRVFAESTESSSPLRNTVNEDRVIVLGKLSSEDTSWLQDISPGWRHAIYVVDDPNPDHRVQVNKGKESNVYLQYILDYYHQLPDYVIFLHAHRSSWHVEFQEKGNPHALERLQLEYLKAAGYVNLRCEWGPGCPDEVYPFRQLSERATEVAFAGAWMGIFNNSDVPQVIGTPCCAQFAVTKERILARPLTDYQHYHQWLMKTSLDDDTSGRVFEYLWHIIFGEDPVYCPSIQHCYRNVYGLDYEESSRKT